MNIFFPRRLENQDLLSSEEFDCNEGFGHGVFQVRLLLFLALAIFLKNCHIYTTTLTMGEVDHWCKRPQHWNVSTQEWKRVAIPLEADGQYSKCHQYGDPYNDNDTRMVPCTAWEYDEDQAAASAVSQWELVCDRRFLRAALVLLNVFSFTIVGIGAGSVADSVGRKPVLIAITVSLLASTIGLCLGKTFLVHAVAKFIASGSAAAQVIVGGTLFFEVTIHENRPLHIAVAGVLAVIASELWFEIMRLVTVHWTLKQAVFLAPTFLSAAAFCLSVEFPRWLAAKARFQEAEDTMLAAAKINLFPLYNAGCLTEKVKSRAANNIHSDRGSAVVEMFQGVSLRKRAVAVFFTYFAAYFVSRIVVQSSLIQKSLILHWISFALVVLSSAGMLYAIARVTLLQFIITCFAVLGALQCMLSLTIEFDSLGLIQGLLLCAKALSFVAYTALGMVSLELFPTAVRATSGGRMIGFGGIGATVASVSTRLQNVGRREDVNFAIAGSLMFAFVLVLRTLPRNTTAECAKITVNRVSIFREQNVERMKKTLEQREGLDLRSPSSSVSVRRKVKQRECKDNREHKSPRSPRNPKSPAPVRKTQEKACRDRRGLKCPEPGRESRKRSAAASSASP